MTPELRALADRFIYEQATVKHIALSMPSDALSRPVHGGEWTVRQLLAHLGSALCEFQRAVEKLVASEDPLDGIDYEDINRRTAARYATADLAELLSLLGSGLNGLVAAFEALPDHRLADPLAASDVLTVLRSLGEHCLQHAIPLVDALPEVRFDPLVLNWLLSADFDDEASTAWQSKLFADAEEYIASQPDEDEEDEA